MSWYFSVALPADPAPCHDAAASLRSVARAARLAADFLAGQAVLSREDFSGIAAQSYRVASAALSADSQGVAGDTHALAEALNDYAVRIAAVRRALTRIRGDAVSQGFAVVDDLVEWVPAPETDVDAAYQRLEARAVRAQTEAQTAYADWWRAVQDHTTGPLASPTYAPALEPALEPPTEPPTEPPAQPPADPVPQPAPDRHHERRPPAEHGVDFKFAQPVRWQPCPTATEGALP